ncbi:glyoxylase-like metal-dependent hydrolase (beta-lactamase superfamily II) [Lacibacter cauensis]|uniref:Glyoxylase-like metal-dependent hydrolase (Beta-lactamase superfamily II) n=1 Tax=Lacibacter cauensis TaxID=510947 RepID=A0A562SR40_9BACT|nr:MBL fold metallo-hydrolase [Lacibacter cauensis]TWI83484.1 glyoxylase-like metal-dependent hydrolase (beta-lactamase superfamily II) [Lacibacter cauensis]
MFIQQLYTNCLSEAAYYVESEGECVVIDPMRDVDAYINLARERNATIKYIFETHIHADFVSGHLDLAKATNAPIVYGPNASTSFPIYVAKDREQFKIGKLVLEVLHTPGHTMESSCFLLKDTQGKNHCIFTGDTLFVGDVGRPDLAQGGEVTQEELAGKLYDSLQEKIIPLADDVLVYPAHGPGSSCGKNLGPETFSTIGEQKTTNYALQQQTKEQFTKAVTQGLEAPPKYFPVNVRINKEGYDLLQTVLQKGMTALSIDAFKQLLKQPKTVLLDTRAAATFTIGFIPGSISIGLEGRFAEWAGALLSFDENIVLVCEQGKEEETITRLARVGFEKITGYLSGGFEAWQQAGEEIDMIIDVEADELAMDLPHDDNLVVVDVRKETEFAEGHVKDAVNLPLAEMNDPGLIANIEDRDNLYVHCAGGYRSVIASSILKKQGFHNLRNVVGGFEKIKEQKIDIVKENSVLN